MYKRVNNSRYMVAGLTGIVLVMSIFTWLMYGIAQRIDVMTATIVTLGKDVHTMTEVQKVMVHDIGALNHNISKINGSVHSMSRNMAVMTGSTMRISQDMGRTSHMFSSPMNYFWNMGQ